MAKQRNPKSLMWRAIEDAEAPVYLIDESLTLRYANASFLNLLELDARDWIGKSLSYSPDGGEESSLSWIGPALLPPPDMTGQPVARFGLTLPLPQHDGSAKREQPGEIRSQPWSATSVSFAAGESSCYLVTLHPPVADDSSVEPMARRLQQKWLEFRKRIPDLSAPLLLMGESAAAESLREQVSTFQKVNANLQIEAAPGSDEEQLARFVHQGRPAALRGPLLTLECTLLDAELLQTTLRDLVRSSQDVGAGRGCLLLLNVDRLVESGQHELLNLLSFPQVLFTTIVTTSQSLSVLARQGRFLSDLARRLSILSLQLPRLRERAHDLPEMLHASLQLENTRRREPLSGFSDEAMQQLMRYGWPRNVEEVREVAEAAALTAEGAWVELKDLPHRLRHEVLQPEETAWQLEPMSMDRFLGDVEAMVIRQSLSQCHGNKTKAAQLLGMTRATFHRKVDALTEQPPEGEGQGSEGAE